MARTKDITRFPDLFDMMSNINIQLHELRDEWGKAGKPFPYPKSLKSASQELSELLDATREDA